MALEQAAPRTPLDMMTRETQVEADFKQTFTLQGLALSDWDNQQPTLVHNLLSLISPCALPDVAPTAPRKPATLHCVDSTFMQELNWTCLPSETDIYTEVGSQWASSIVSCG